MSRILALDTSTDACSVALSLDGEILYEFVIEPRRHTHLLLPMVERLLAQAGTALNSLDAIAFGRGPGSFAGIRIATGAAQGLALGADLPLLPISTLAAMAVSARALNSGHSHVLTALDARMDEVYWGAFDISGALPQALMEESVRSPADAEAPVHEGDWLAVGSGWRYTEQMPAALTAKVADKDESICPDARAMLVLAQAQLVTEGGVAPELALPVYLREGAWKKRDQQ
ncbi:tRNA (adenosine(37)-N6)-threonylcarbamoyltransferase complex dimerization subunit type 1 TsaB [Marinobacterium zhoushanense]|uniref:tRNA threonylcarbamoyladenosine biosynthesis protein TsaB n=1 Tax=Marinobacterium zhoushanense TaxID=1679163 RepID=A0ABQ1KB56_9GAMM|nr:tRNA (adenosine(37)-N6)-threonylcarbamoyltransferase complex dimerization subunit type 1 TsaB [Marinobacterium zhoushanense]GGB88613.1 tRNA (adenosine(37)-N6)-threonylcarbamoyltransferase complex dimerization subunit type 1 TsaB [Marinobacterium zhoushanense]